MNNRNMNRIPEMIELSPEESATIVGGNIVVRLAEFVWGAFKSYAIDGFLHNTFSAEAWNAYHPGLDDRYPPILSY